MASPTSNGVTYNERYSRTRPVTYGDLEALLTAISVAEDYFTWLVCVRGKTLAGAGGMVRDKLNQARGIARTIFGNGPDDVQPVETSACQNCRVLDGLIVELCDLVGAEHIPDRIYRRVESRPRPPEEPTYNPEMLEKLKAAEASCRPVCCDRFPACECSALKASEPNYNVPPWHLSKRVPGCECHGCRSLNGEAPQ